MIYKISLKLIIMVSVLFLIVVVGGYYLFNSGVFADDTFMAGTPSVQLDYEADVDSDGNDETVSLLTYEVDGENIYILEVVQNFLFKRRLVLSEFEVDIRFCSEPIIDAKESGKFICVVGYVGVHSERVEVYNFKNSRFDKVYFSRDDQRFDNLISDAPNIIVRDQGQNDVQICSDSRNYDKNPLLDFFRTCYILNSNTEFEFDSVSGETMKASGVEGAILG